LIREALRLILAPAKSQHGAWNNKNEWIVIMALLNYTCALTIIVASILFKPNIFLWDENRKLESADFKKNPSSSLDSLTGLSYTGLSVLKQEDVSGYIDSSTIGIYAWFNQDSSWIIYKNDSLVLLHEQIHFDITEVYSRKMRKEIVSMYNTHSKIIYSQLDSFYNLYFDSCAWVQDEFDTQTNHGINALKQAQWRIKISQNLQNLSNWSLMLSKRKKFYEIAKK
jgi:hypothetical protein